MNELNNGNTVLSNITEKSMHTEAQKSYQKICYSKYLQSMNESTFGQLDEMAHSKEECGGSQYEGEQEKTVVPSIEPLKNSPNTVWLVGEQEKALINKLISTKDLPHLKFDRSKGSFTVVVVYHLARD